MAEGSRVTASWTLLETKNMISLAKAEAGVIKELAYKEAEREADKIKAKAQDEVAEILRAADDIELEARFTRDDAIAFKQQMVAEAAEIKAAAEAEAAQMRQQQAQFLSLVKEKISNITVETAMETGILDLSSH